MISTPTTLPAASSSLFVAPRAGIQRGIQQAAVAAEKISRGDLAPAHIVAQIQADVLVRANTTALRTADDLLRTLLDTVA